ncbi:unnamed protein product [Adineta steineri]|uniref:Vacuolar membrane protease n=1 Tax=Adineta steineri TaxID=433720 RepID=A0A813RZ38_9BILA|nr:unnamed protein product [Adineta steineri]CAF0792323.1 unnamed protein product [Adineta steineri]CAF0894474.1 unnamed protein product [Adineta steineri]
MQNQAEEIVLLPTTHGRHSRDENQIFPDRQKSYNEDASDVQHQHILKRLIKPTNPASLYKHLLLWVILFSCLFLLAAPLALYASYALPSINPFRPTVLNIVRPERVKSRTIPLYEFSDERARDFYTNSTRYSPRFYLNSFQKLVNDPSITFSQVNLIVLFTGAEEMGLNGAEAFIRNHPWKNDIRRFININSSGSNEKAILYRVKPSQLVREYSRVPRPHANVIGDEILELTGSDTDYSVFTSKGSLLGYDFAFYLDGYNYHTLIDKPSTVENGALQHLGENTLVLSRNILLGNIDLQQPETIFDDDDVIYYDVLGRHLITYTKSTSVIIQSVLIGFVILIGILVIIIDHIWYRRNFSIDNFSYSVYSYFKYPLLIRILSIITFFLCYLLSILIGIVFAIFIAFIISKIRPLSWYGNSTIAFFLYGLLYLVGIILCEAFWGYLNRLFLSKYPKKKPMEIQTINYINRVCFSFERH